jgi:hypothetical protein
VTPTFDGVHAFLDHFPPGRHAQTDWNEFAAWGLNRVSVGIASGDSAIRALYHQEWADEDFRTTFAALKEAGIGVSVLAMVGVGGLEHARSHVTQTAELIRSLDLQRGDFVFLLNENELRDPHQPFGCTIALDPSAWQQQQSALKTALGPLKDRKVKVLPYTMEKQRI